MLEIVKCTENDVVKIDEWIKREGYGLMAKCGDRQIAVNSSIANCIDGALIPFFGQKDFVLTALNYKTDKEESVVADVYFSDSESLTSFALFLAEVE